MKLNAEPFLGIKNGTKKYELRLYDEKRKLVRAGDTIEFTEINSGEKCVVTVLGLHKFGNFEELYASLPLEQCGYAANEILTASPTDMEKYYSEEQQSRYGVIAIEIKRI